MSAPIGNRFWEQRSKHGRDQLFESPELMWEGACEYFKWCEDNPLIDIDYRGKDADKVELYKIRAFTMSGLCLFLGCNTQYFNQFKKNCSQDFSLIITRIEEIVYTQKFTYAAANLLNSTIISRELGLTEKSEQKIIQEQPLFGEEG